MLWGFFDESGEHDKATGQLYRLTVGGCWAPFASWEMFSMEWKATLDSFGINVFHMTDFEASRGEFEGWNEPEHKERRNSFLNALLDIMKAHISQYVGFSEIATDGKFKEAYEANLISMFANSSFNDNPSIVLARHPDYGPDKMAALVEATERALAHLHFRVNSWAFGEPSKICPLQAADLIAYEFSRADRENEFERPRRYPLRRLTAAMGGWKMV
jgi:hypothetical protein